MTRTNDAEGAVEVTLDGAEWESGDGGYLMDLHLFDKAKDEDCALAAGEACDRLPDERDLLLGDEVRFRRAFAVGDTGCDLGDIDGMGGGVFPEAEAAGAGVVAGEVEGDAEEPGCHGAIFAEAGAGSPGAEEGLLGESLSGVAVAQGGEQKTEDAGLVEGDDIVEVVERGGASVDREGKTCRRKGLDVFRHDMHPGGSRWLGD